MCWLLSLAAVTANVAAGYAQESARSNLPTLPSISDLSDDARIIRIALEDFESQPADVHEWIHDRLDTCAIDRDDDDVRRAVLFLNPDEVAALAARGVPFHDAGSLADHVATFAPWNTLAQKSIPSIERLIGRPAGAGAPRGADCQAIGISLQPYDVYHDIDESLCFLQNLAAAYPEIARLVNVGQTIEGRSIWALKLSDNPDIAEPDEASILFKGTTHAREWATHETMLYIAEYLTSRYEADEQVRRIVDRSVVWLIPISNPDGFSFTWTDQRMWRKNRRVNSGTSCRGVDINRNYAYNWGFDTNGSSTNKCSETYRGASAASEPETQAIQNLVAQQKFAIAISFHSYSQLWLYPWGYTTQVTPESYTSMRAIANKLSSLVFDVHGRLYIPGQGSYTIYRTNGDFNDFAYGTHGTMGFTPEVRPRLNSEGGFLLPENQILACAEENMAAALWLMDNVSSVISVSRPEGGPLFGALAPEGSLSMALPATPARQRPTDSLGLDSTHADNITTRLDDALHNPPFWGTFAGGFEGCGAGSGYIVKDDNDAALQAWANALTSYRALPFVFEDGAEVMLSNRLPGVNIIGIPSSVSIPLADVSIFKRIINPATGDFGATENLLEERSALQDATSPSPWINWTWEYVRPDGTSEFAHPAGAGGADTHVHPFRAYSFNANVASYQFGSTQQSGAVYLLRFPVSSLDCNRNDVLDAIEIASQSVGDCNQDGIPDDCQEDCNGNGLTDACDPVLTDIAFFVSQLLSDAPDPAHFCLLDMNSDSQLNGADVQPFVVRLLSL